MNKFLSCIALFFFIACSPEKPAPSKPQVPTGTSSARGAYVLEITPKEVDRAGTLYAVAHGFSLSEAAITWLVNGKPVSSYPPSQFKAINAKKGDTVQARAVFQGKEMLSDSVKLKNSSPGISKVAILPEVFKPGDTLSAEAEGSDIDGDEITITYEWNKNGEPAGSEKKIKATLRRGDIVSVRITPFDGEVYGHPAILQREIRNFPPMIAEDKKFVMKGDLYTYQVKAVDPDGDTLVFALKAAPQGMTIEQDTGLIRWQVPSAFEGKTSFSVSVSDGHGGEAKQDFVFQTGPEARQ